MECQLIGGTFAIVIQILLGVVVLSALFVKRYWDVCGCRSKPKPERDFRTWSLDVGKQAIGSCFAHGCNLVLAILLSTISLQSDDDDDGSGVAEIVRPDECAWYFINFLADSVLGIPLSWALLEVVHMIAIRCNLVGLHETGNYGKDNVYCTWLMQLIAWLWIVFATKVTMGLMIWPLGRVLGRFGLWLFRPLHQTPQLELIFVMVIAPTIVNIFVFWIYDNMLMAPSSSPSARQKKTDDDDDMGDDIKKKRDNKTSMTIASPRVKGTAVPTNGTSTRRIVRSDAGATFGPAWNGSSINYSVPIDRDRGSSSPMDDDDDESAMMPD